MKTYAIRNIVINEEEMKLISEAYSAAEEYEYPLFKLDEKGSTRKYTSLSEFEIVMTNERHSWDMGTTYEIELVQEDHKDNSLTDVVYDRTRELYHGQPVACWYDSDSHVYVTGFYDAINKCIFGAEGMPMGDKYHNYEAIDPKHYTNWHLKAYQTLRV